MTARYSVKITDAGVLARIRAMIAAGQDLTPLHQAIGAGVLSLVQLGFKVSQSPQGSAWQALLIRQGQPLRDTGRLRNSLTVQATATGANVGTNTKYAAIHQFGGVIKPKNGPYLIFPTGGGRFARVKQVTIPARPFLPLDDSGAVELPPKYQRTVVERVRSHFMNAGA